MSLTPETRVLLTDALRPPAGHHVATAVGTTYSLDLTALLLAPMSFALFDQYDLDEQVDPLRLLDAVRRYSQHTTVFCQAGGIHVPAQYRTILTFTEDSVLEVLPRTDHALFHPKMWALRFETEDGAAHHRVVVLSRNLTFDTSWDTALVLDESAHGSIAGRPAGEFVRALPDLALHPIETERRRNIAALADALDEVQLAAPAPFTDGHLLPIGLSEDAVWPFPQQAHRQLAISPFLTRPALRALEPIASQRTLISRAESLDLVGADAVADWDVAVLQRLSEPDALETEATQASDGREAAQGEPMTASAHPSQSEPSSQNRDGFADPPQGLHAKTFVLDLPGSRSQVITGSANLTASPWGHQIEFGAVLYGPTDRCGVRASLHGSAEVPGLQQILQPYTPSSPDGLDDAAIEQSFLLEQFHRQLATSDPVLDITASEEAVTCELTLTVPGDPPGDTRIWPIALPKDAHARALDEPLQWRHAVENISPFLAVETTVGSGADAVVRRCVLKARLTGQVPNRGRDALLAHLQNQRDLLRYLVFLLGDPAYDALLAQLDPSGEGSAGEFGIGGTNLDVPLLEPLVRAAGRDEQALARVAELMQAVTQTPGHQGLVPDGFDDLWEIIWQVHLERRS